MRPRSGRSGGMIVKNPTLKSCLFRWFGGRLSSWRISIPGGSCCCGGIGDPSGFLACVPFASFRLGSCLASCAGVLRSFAWSGGCPVGFASVLVPVGVLGVFPSVRLCGRSCCGSVVPCGRLSRCVSWAFWRGFVVRAVSLCGSWRSWASAGVLRRFCVNEKSPRGAGFFRAWFGRVLIRCRPPG